MSASPLSQVRVELTRLRWRRAILLLLVAAVALPALLLAGTAWTSRPMSDAEVDSLLADRYAQREVTRCERRPEAYTEIGAEGTAACRDVVAGWYGGRQPLSVENELDDGLLAASTLVLVLLLLAGTTFVGHDWNTGSMSNQLLFEPRRGRVWATKAAALVLVAGLLGTAVLAAYWSGLLGLAASRDLTVPDGVVRDGFEQVLRTGALGAAGALGGYALTMLFRSTVATVGVLFAFAVASGAVLGILGEGSARWTPPLNVVAIVQDGVSYYDESALPPECFTGRGGGPECDGERTIGAADGALYLGTGLLVVVAASVLSFRRRDVP